MRSNMSKQRSYTEEFKKQAVELASQLNSITKAASQLGISDVNIHKWKKIYRSTSSGVSQTELAEIKRLKKENEELKKVNFILSKAAAFFSQDHLK